MNAAVRSILLVEDNPGDADLVRELLAGATRHGAFAVFCVSRLAEAVEHLERERVDAVLLDLGLPDARGLQSVRALRSHGDFPIVVLTGADDEALALACMEAGADDYLSKNETATTSLRRALSYAIARRREQQLRERSHALFETINLIVLEVDGEGLLTYANGYFFRLTGFRRHEVMYRDVFALVPEAERRRAVELFVGLMQGKPNFQVEVPIRTRDGQQRSIGWHNTPLRDVQGRSVGTISIGEDVTEKRLLEERLRESQKMEGIGRLAGGVAHDFNNILTAILGNVELLKLDLPPDGEAQVLLDEVQRVADSAAHLTRQLLAFSRRQRLEPRAVEVNGTLAGFERMLRRMIGEHIEFEMRLGPEVGQVYVDPGQLEQVLINLVVNARDAMPDGGRLTLRTESVFVDEGFSLTHQLAKPGEFVVISVADTGCGMDEATRSRVFEPFFTTKPQGEGTGLGLATVYGIVQQSGGQITVYSEPGRGSCFKVYLPRHHGGDAAQDAVPARGEPRLGTERVLLVEDDDAVRLLTQQVLARHGYTVHAARDGLEGFELVERLGGGIDLVLTDVVMPNLGGLELVQRLRDAGHSMPVIYMSGYATDAIERGTPLDPQAAFLQKPFSREALLHAVAERLDRR